MAAGLGWLILATVPFCGVVFIYQGMAERFMYFASIGLALAMSSILSMPFTAQRKLVAAFILVWMAWGVWRLESRLTDWSDPVLLYQSSLDATPDPVLFLILDGLGDNVETTRRPWACIRKRFNGNRNMRRPWLALERPCP